MIIEGDPVAMSPETAGVSKKTFMLDRRIERKLRYIQGQLIANDEDENWSLSKLINVMLLQALLSSRGNISNPNFVKAFLEGKMVNIDDERIDEIIGRLQGF
jgi:hypothetical protein